MERVLIVEDKTSLAQMLEEALAPEGLTADLAPSAEQAERWVAEGRRYLFVLTDLRLPGKDGISVLRLMKEHDPDCPVIVMTAYGTIDHAVEAMKLGAFDFIQKPLDLDRLLLLVRRCAELRQLRFENLLLREEFQRQLRLPAIVGESPRIVEVSQAIQKVAPTDAIVLLQGESGTGKELFARAIHQLSPRRERPFVAVNCAAIPDTLIENELFGHERGAYTGAVARQIGKFELADGGTIFLDEIGELGLGVQSKILRVIQERRFERIGGNATIEADSRIVCATNRELQQEVREGRFREDLFFRIHVFPVTVPPLRTRKDDLPALTDFFLQRFARELGRPGLAISAAARETLAAHDWPGNIRELQNALERAAIVCEGNRIEPRDLALTPTGAQSERSLRDALDLTGTLDEATERTARLVERIKIADALRTAGSRNAAADLLGISPRTLAAKMKEHGIE